MKRRFLPSSRQIIEEDERLETESSSAVWRGGSDRWRERERERERERHRPTVEVSSNTGVVGLNTPRMETARRHRYPRTNTRTK